MALNHELSDLFARMADIMDIRGENTFKVLAFRKVSRILRDLPGDIRTHVEEGTVDQIEGIGQHSARVIEEYVRTGRSTDHEELAASVPAGLMPLLHVEGLGPRTIALLWKKRNITSADELKKAIEQGALAGIKGIGQKKIDSMKQALESAARSASRLGIGQALPVAGMFVQRLRGLPGVNCADIAGSLRRRRETIGDVDLLCCVRKVEQAPAVIAAFAGFPEVARVLGRGPTKGSIITAGGLQVDLRVLGEEHFGAALLYFTGSKEHNVAIRSLALKKGLTLNEWGLYRLDEYEKAGKKTSEAPPIKPVASRTEKEIYAKLGMEYIEPELREARGEVEAAIAGTLPKLITRADIRGDLHAHTTASDGVNSIEEMAGAARSLGYEFLAITDHSRSQVIANGLDERRLLQHIELVRRIGSKIRGLTLLAGAEVDILTDGRLDYDDQVLAELDIVIASPHISLRQDQRKATDRLLRAIDNRHVNIIGHPTGRMIGGREGLPLDFAAIFRAAAASGTALEINAGYPRLDLDEVNSRAAIEAGVMLAINTDAHGIGGFADIEWGLGVARRAWVTPKHVINCMKVAELKKFLAK
jgi:DNA polymerase (family X)